MCISRSLDARVAALRAAVGCGWTYRRGAAWAWHAMPICAFRRSCTLPCTPCTLSCTPFLAIVCMACREAKKHWKRLINEGKQEKSPAHFNRKWCAAKCAWRAEGVQRTSEWHPFSLAYAPPCLAGNYGASRLRCLQEGTHEACETVSDGFHALLRTQYAMRRN